MKTLEDIRLEAREPKWRALNEYVGGESGEALVSALRELYSLYDGRIIDWFAGLYDSDVGGYYYSNSARDNKTVVYKGKEYLLLPDAESTRQALAFWEASGMSDAVGGAYERAIPEQMAKEIGEFIYSLQDPDGFFYHKQWGKDIRLSRRARDFNWCRGMLRRFGITPKYKTVIDATKSEENDEIFVPEHLKSKESFANYLENLKIDERSYPAGNELVAQDVQIKAAGRMEQCIEFLNAHQNAENGLWHNESNYYGVNGLLKISGLYNAAGLPLPNAMRAAKSAIAAISSDEPMGTVVDIYNTWFAVRNILSNLREQGGDEGNEMADGIVTELRRIAPDAIRKSREKISIFKKPDGAFSYCRNNSSEISQGAPVAIPGTPEGDVNATIISSMGLIENIYLALELEKYRVPLFVECDRQRYIELLSENKKKNCEE